MFDKKNLEMYNNNRGVIMKIGIASDHRGYNLKQEIIKYLKNKKLKELVFYIKIVIIPLLKLKSLIRN